MTLDLPRNALELRSLVTSQGTLELSLHDVPVTTEFFKVDESSGC
jgi:NADPH2:quinone reductase